MWWLIWWGVVLISTNVYLFSRQHAINIHEDAFKMLLVIFSSNKMCQHAFVEPSTLSAIKSTCVMIFVITRAIYCRHDWHISHQGIILEKKSIALMLMPNKFSKDVGLFYRTSHCINIELVLRSWSCEKVCQISIKYENFKPNYHVSVFLKTLRS